MVDNGDGGDVALSFLTLETFATSSSMRSLSEWSSHEKGSKVRRDLLLSEGEDGFSGVDGSVEGGVFCNEGQCKQALLGGQNDRIHLRDVYLLSLWWW